MNLLVENSNVTMAPGLAELGEEINKTYAVFPLAMRYSNWETDKIIGQELWQNMVTSLVVIFLTVLVFLGSLRASCIVIFVVTSTILEVCLSLVDCYTKSGTSHWLIFRLPGSCISGT